MTRPDLETLHVDRQLASLLLEGRPILLTARASGASGKGAYQAAAMDLHECAAKLRAVTGIDLTDELPSEKELVELLRQATPIKSREKGTQRPFTNRFVELRLASFNTCVLLSTGSGKKLDDSSLQPFVTRATQVAKTIRPALMFAKRWDRIARRAWALGDLMTELTELGTWVGDGRRGNLTRVGGPYDIEIFLSTSMGEEEAGKLPVQTRDGMSRRTGRRMVDGSVDFHVGLVPPPGLTHMTLRSATGGLGRKVLILDDARWRPSANAVGGVSRP